MYTNGNISIHAPCTGSDDVGDRALHTAQQFQSTLPARGATYCSPLSFPATNTFQSTLPARGATPIPPGGKSIQRDFNPRSLHGERLASCGSSGSCRMNFNPRSLHGERRSSSWGSTSRMRFQSTLPARGATNAARRHRLRQRISIHAPCTGSDVCFCRPCKHIADFNPRSLHGERLYIIWCILGIIEFQSTLPARGATVIRRELQIARQISIHAPCTGSDLAGKRGEETSILFQSTLPARGATHVYNTTV